MVRHQNDRRIWATLAAGMNAGSIPTASTFGCVEPFSMPVD
jgi:hypothetical protein